MDLLLGILGALVLGGVSGWLAGLIMKGSGFGLVGNIIVGMIGGFIGSWLLGLVGIGFSGPITTIIGSVLGAIILLFVIGLVKRYVLQRE